VSPGNAAASITTVSPADAGSHLCYLHVVVDRYSTCPAGPWCVRCHRFGDLMDRFSRLLHSAPVPPVAGTRSADCQALSPTPVLPSES